MIHDKIKENHSYQVATNYWTPLHNDNDDEPTNVPDKINAIASTTVTTKQKENKWTRRVVQRQEQRIMLDSGAMSHFISENMNLTKGDMLFKEVYLPDDTKLKASTKTKLPFTQLSDRAREADIRPGLLQRSLMSISKMSEEGYHNFPPRRRRRHNSR